MITARPLPPRSFSVAPFSLGAAMLFLAACATTPPPIVSAPAPRLPGMEMLMGQPPQAATNMLGAPSLDRQEGTSRQLQFAGGCILDLFYYPRAQTGMVATFADARLPDGRDFSPGECLALLVRNKK